MLLLGVLVLFAATPAWASDADGDGVADDLDNCIALANPDQTDTDLDYSGDACDADDDGDSIPDSVDPAPLDSSL